MRSLRRFSAVLSVLSLLQLLLLGSAAPCTMTSLGASHARMSSAAMTAVSGHSAHAACEAPGSSDHCGMPWSTGQCAAMGACTPTVAAPAAVLALVIAPHRALEVRESLRCRSSAGAAPELPPPRA